MKEVFSMTWWEIVLVVLVSIVAVLAILVLIGRRLQKKQDETSKTMEAVKQTVSALVIDKKKMKIKEANLPKSATDQIPWYMKAGKYPMAKIKVGPQIMTLFCDPTVFKALPLKTLVKLDISGAYITAFSTGKKGDKKKTAPAPLTAKEKRAKKKAERAAARAAKKQDKEAEKALKNLK